MRLYQALTLSLDFSGGGKTYVLREMRPYTLCIALTVQSKQKTRYYSFVSPSCYIDEYDLMTVVQWLLNNLKTWSIQSHFYTARYQVTFGKTKRTNHLKTLSNSPRLKEHLKDRLFITCFGAIQTPNFVRQFASRRLLLDSKMMFLVSKGYIFLLYSLQIH